MHRRWFLHGWVHGLFGHVAPGWLIGVHHPGMGGYPSGAAWIGIHHPMMGGYPSGPKLDWDSSPKDGRVPHRGPDLIGIHHPGLVGIARRRAGLVGARLWSRACGA
eukprot:2940237-Prymnesium_polylepis.1